MANSAAHLHAREAVRFDFDRFWEDGIPDYIAVVVNSELNAVS